MKNDGKQQGTQQNAYLYCQSEKSKPPTAKLTGGTCIDLQALTSRTAMRLKNYLPLLLNSSFILLE